MIVFEEKIIEWKCNQYYYLKKTIKILKGL